MEEIETKNLDFCSTRALIKDSNQKFQDYLFLSTTKNNDEI